MRFFRRAPLLALAVAAGGCELTEVTTAPADDLLVVEAVLRTDVDRQRILLHRTLQGREAGPVDSAEVVVTDSDGTEHQFRQDVDCYRIDIRYLQADSIAFQGSCYSTRTFDGSWVRPGETFDLRVETRDGVVARGRTTVPGDFGLSRLPHTSSFEFGPAPDCSLRPNTRLPVAWTTSRGAWGYIAQLRITGLRRALQPRGIDAPEPLELRGLAVSQSDTSIVLPTQFGVFERFQYDQDLLTAIQEGFPDETQMDLVVAAADRNWVNGVRGGSFNPSGQVRISSVIGEDVVGVFGSIVPLRTRVLVRAESPIERCAGAGAAE